MRILNGVAALSLFLGNHCWAYDFNVPAISALDIATQRVKIERELRINKVARAAFLGAGAVGIAALVYYLKSSHAGLYVKTSQLEKTVNAIFENEQVAASIIDYAKSNPEKIGAFIAGLDKVTAKSWKEKLVNSLVWLKNGIVEVIPYAIGTALGTKIVSSISGLQFHLFAERNLYWFIEQKTQINAQVRMLKMYASVLDPDSHILRADVGQGVQYLAQSLQTSQLSEFVQANGPEQLQIAINLLNNPDVAIKENVDDNELYQYRLVSLHLLVLSVVDQAAKILGFMSYKTMQWHHDPTMSNKAKKGRILAANLLRTANTVGEQLGKLLQGFSDRSVKTGLLAVVHDFHYNIAQSVTAFVALEQS